MILPYLGYNIKANRRKTGRQMSGPDTTL